MSLSVMSPQRLVEDVDPDLLLVELLERVRDRTQRAGHVGLEDDPQLLGLAGLDLAVEVLEGRATAAIPALRGGRLCRLDHRAGFLVVLDDPQDVAGLGYLGQPEDHHRRGGAGLRDPLALVVLERTDAAERLADDDDVADLERAGLDECGRDRTAALVELRFDDRADGRCFRFRLELLEVRDEQQDRSARRARRRVFADTGTSGTSPPNSSTTTPASASSVFTRSGFDRLVDLVEGDDDRDLGRLGVADGLEGLGHDTVICRHNDDRDVRDGRRGRASP